MDMGRKLIDKFIADTRNDAVLEKEPAMEGRIITMLLAPKKVNSIGFDNTILIPRRIHRVLKPADEWGIGFCLRGSRRLKPAGTSLYEVIRS